MFLHNTWSANVKNYTFFSPCSIFNVFVLAFHNSSKEVDFIRKEEISNELSLFIPESITNNSNFSNYAIATYCVLQALSIPTQMQIQCITYHQIVFYLTGQIAQHRNRITDYIKCGINELIDNHVIIKKDEFQKHLILDCSNLWMDTQTEKFTVITFHEIREIFKVENINNFMLLKYFILLISTISSKITVFLENGCSKNRVVGNFTIEYLAELSGISDRTAIEYNKILEDIKLIYIYRQEDFVIDKENNIKRLANIYGRFRDIAYIERFATNQQKHFESYRYLENNNKKANNKRRLAQMYQQLLKGGGKNYTEKEILDIYAYVLSENQKYERLFEKEGYEDYLEKIRSTDVFKKYDYISFEEEDNF